MATGLYLRRAQGVLRRVTRVVHAAMLGLRGGAWSRQRIELLDASWLIAPGSFDPGWSGDAAAALEFRGQHPRFAAIVEARWRAAGIGFKAAVPESSARAGAAVPAVVRS